jgi:hypothetical protein
VPKPEKVWESAPKPEKVGKSAPKPEKVWESLLNAIANGNYYLFAVQMLF